MSGWWESLRESLEDYTHPFLFSSLLPGCDLVNCPQGSSAPGIAYDGPNHEPKSASPPPQVGSVRHFGHIDQRVANSLVEVAWVMVTDEEGRDPGKPWFHPVREMKDTCQPPTRRVGPREKKKIAEQGLETGSRSWARSQCVGKTESQKCIVIRASLSLN